MWTLFQAYNIVATIHRYPGQQLPPTLLYADMKASSLVWMKYYIILRRNIQPNVVQEVCFLLQTTWLWAVVRSTTGRHFSILQVKANLYYFHFCSLLKTVLPTVPFPSPCFYCSNTGVTPNCNCQHIYLTEYIPIILSIASLLMFLASSCFLMYLTTVSNMIVTFVACFGSRLSSKRFLSTSLSHVLRSDISTMYTYYFNCTSSFQMYFKVR